MPFSNLAQLRNTINDYLIGGDEAVTDTNIDDFIALTEQQMNSRLRTYWQEQTASVTLTECSEGPLPSDFLSIRNVYVAGSPKRQLYYLTPTQVEEKYAYRTSGCPYHFSISGSQISVYPSSATTVSVLYYQKIPALADEDTNWVLQNYPTAYLFGSLYQACLFKLAPEEKAQQWASAFDTAIQDIKTDDQRARFPRAAARISGITP